MTVFFVFFFAVVCVYVLWGVVETRIKSQSHVFEFSRYSHVCTRSFFC